MSEKQQHAEAAALPGSNLGQKQEAPARAPRSRAFVAAVPVILVNAVAFAGQLAFLREHLHWPLAGQIMMAVALESIAVYLAYHAHVAQVANDSALRLRMASYAFGAGIGGLNYSHYAGAAWRPTFAAVAVGLMSASSPWLWAIHSRRASRDALLATGQIEPHALRLGPTRWAWHPLRSGRVMFMATWKGITEPREAVTQWEAGHGRQNASAAPAPVPAGSRKPEAEATTRTALPKAPASTPASRQPAADLGTASEKPPAPAAEARPTARVATSASGGVRSIQSQRERLAELVELARAAEKRAGRRLKTRELQEELRLTGSGASTTLVCKALQTLREAESVEDETGEAAQ